MRFGFGKSVCIMCATLVTLASPAMAQYNGDTNNRLKRLEREIETLSRAVYRGEKPPPGGGAPSGSDTTVAANFEVRLSQLEAQLRELTGALEKQQHSVRQLQDEVERALADMETRLSDRRGGAGGAHVISGGAQNIETRTIEPDKTYSSVQTLGTIRQPDTASAPVLTAPSAGASGGTAQGMYDQAFSLLRRSDYPQAEKSFRAFLGEYPNHSLASNAQYWLAETYYVRNEYEQAARLFAEGYQKHPESQKAPDNLLKLGLSLAALGKTEDACLTYAQFSKQFANDTSPVATRAKSESKRLGCE